MRLAATAAPVRSVVCASASAPLYTSTCLLYATAELCLVEHGLHCGKYLCLGGGGRSGASHPLRRMNSPEASAPPVPYACLFGGWWSATMPSDLFLVPHVWHPCFSKRVCTFAFCELLAYWLPTAGMLFFAFAPTNLTSDMRNFRNLPPSITNAVHPRIASAMRLALLFVSSCAPAADVCFFEKVSYTSPAATDASAQLEMPTRFATTGVAHDTRVSLLICCAMVAEMAKEIDDAHSCEQVITKLDPVDDKREAP